MSCIGVWNRLPIVQTSTDTPKVRTRLQSVTNALVAVQTTSDIDTWWTRAGDHQKTMVC